MNKEKEHNHRFKAFIINRSELLGRIDAPVYLSVFHFKSNIYQIHKLSEVAFINPTTSFDKFEKSSLISFIPMESVDEIDGIVKSYFTKQVMESKGFTRFKENDLIWAKITPCMQNGKSAVVKNLLQGVGCGSTEFFIIRPKDNRVTPEYLHLLLRDKRILSNAQNYFGGSAGQQRVSKDFLINLKIPVPPVTIQNEITQLFRSAFQTKLQKESIARSLLAGIDNYLLQQLGITLPEKKNHLSSKTFIVNFNQLTGVRFDPKPFEKYYTDLQVAISNSGYKPNKLKNIITHLSSGDWGIDDSPVYANDFERCLVIRSTEFDNEYNLMLDSKRVKYRLINREKLLKLDMQRNDILIEKSGGSPDQPVGRVVILDSSLGPLNKFCFSNFIHKIRCDQSKVDAQYLYFLLRSFHTIGLTETLQSQTNGIRNLMMKSYLDLTIPIPPLEKQSEIVTHINSVRQQARQLQSEAAVLLENAKQEIEKMILG